MRRDSVQFEDESRVWAQAMEDTTRSAIHPGLDQMQRQGEDHCRGPLVGDISDGGVAVMAPCAVLLALVPIPLFGWLVIEPSWEPLVISQAAIAGQCSYAARLVSASERGTRLRRVCHALPHTSSLRVESCLSARTSPPRGNDSALFSPSSVVLSCLQPPAGPALRRAHRVRTHIRQPVSARSRRASRRAGDGRS